MPKAPLASPEAAPTTVDAIRPGMDLSAKPMAISPAAIRTKMLMASCIGAGATLASSQTPIGVAIRQPIINGISEGQ